MGSNAFGKIFRITTWGESHGQAIGVVIDGCPAGIALETRDIQEALDRRLPGLSPYTSPRKEKDRAEILSGLFEGKSTGAPLTIIIANSDQDSSKYEPIKEILRPGHANFTYLEKYGLFDYRGGGRASARETACRVAAGAVAQKILKLYDIHLTAYIKQIGEIVASINPDEQVTVENSPLFCPDVKATAAMINLLEAVKKEGDSIGGVVEFAAHSLPVGLGDPTYDKLEARLAYAMMSIPATKGFEMGSGFKAASMRGSSHNDGFIKESGKVKTATNHAGGTLGGISTSMALIGRVAFKPTSSIQQAQESLTLSGDATSFVLPVGSRHDPCVAIRAVPVVEAMAALVLVDALLLNRSARL